MASIRTFIAINAPDSIRDKMLLVQDQLRTLDADVRWESSDKFHATIKFLGNTEESKLPDILSSIQFALSAFRSFEITFQTIGSFPNSKRPRVVWIGCENDDGTLLQIKTSLDERLIQYGFEIEKRDFHPHITLGRVRSEKRLAHLTPMLEKLTFEPQKTRLDKIYLMRSVLRPAGADYSVLNVFQLQP